MDGRPREWARRIRRLGGVALNHPLFNQILLVTYVVVVTFLVIGLARGVGLIGNQLWLLLQAPLSIGVGNTIASSVSVILVGVLVGFFVGWARVSGHPLVSWPAGVYVDLVRGVPPLILITLTYFLLPLVLQIDDPNAGLTFAVLALGLHSGAYQAEIFRAGFQSIPRAQVEAAEALGLTRGQSMRHVILPQTFRVTLPALGNEFATIVKDTSLLAALSVQDLTYWGRNNAQSAIGHLDWVLGIWIVVALLYFVLTYVITHAVVAIEQSYRVPGLGTVSL